MLNKLSYYLKLSGMTHAEFARRVGISKIYVSLICTGRRRPSLPVALRMADVLDRRVDKIFLAYLPPDSGFCGNSCAFSN